MYCLDKILRFSGLRVLILLQRETTQAAAKIYVVCFIKLMAVFSNL